MAKIKFPEKLEVLLKDDDLYAPIRELADRVGTILSDNKLTFFPNYTDHGIEHINAVLDSMVKLIPDDVWELSKPNKQPSLLTPQDAAIIIGSALLHDIAMHLTVKGFRELIAADTRFKPVDWFNEEQEDHTADRPWPDLWDDFCREARRFSDRELTNIIGLKEVRNDWKFTGLPETGDINDVNLRLVIGEFLRRHHARLAHEIAIYGFPGLIAGHNADEFPAMGSQDSEITSLADLIGLTARSHGMSLRVCKAYLDAHYEGDLQPLGSSVLYPMALLRVADFLQLDRKRAPAILLQLRQPQSPVSVDEWHKHKAVEHIGPANDPRGVMFRISKKITHAVYLQIEELLKQLQLEMDHASAVLDECYGTQTAKNLDRLGLAIRRVHSNLNTPAYRKQLPFVPKRTGFSADPNLLGLLVEPLYGNHPGVGIRELIQNSVDAVRELEAWCEKRGKDINELHRYDQEPDVLIEYREQEEGVFDVHVTDKGIGMTADTINNFFLRAGASFRNSPHWTKEHLGDDGKPRVIRSGRFGIGAFAIFLLGNRFTMQTRHVEADESEGYEIQGNQEESHVEISRKSGVPIGTSITIPFSSISEFVRCYSNPILSESILNSILWYLWDTPVVWQKIVSGDCAIFVRQAYTIPINPGGLLPQWATLSYGGYDAIHWTFSSVPDISCNGLIIGQPVDNAVPESSFSLYSEDEAFLSPRLSILDSSGELPLRTQRYSLLTESVPFSEKLKCDVVLSFIAHAIVHCPKSPNVPEEVIFKDWSHPLSKTGKMFYGDFRSLWQASPMSWCVSDSHAIPLDPSVVHLLRKQKLCFWLGLYGGKHPGASTGRFDMHRADSFLEDHAMVFRSISFGMSRSRSLIGSERFYEVLIVTIKKLFKMTGVFDRKELIDDIYIVSKEPIDSNRLSFMLDSSMIPYEPRCEFNFEYRFYQYTFGDQKEYVDSMLGGDMAIVSQVLERICDVAIILSEDVLGRNNGDCSLLAETWLKYLGEKAIPFDPNERAVMLEEASKHPELKRHIDKWQRMTPQGKVVR